jgi:hypothetical protein
MAAVGRRMAGAAWALGSMANGGFNFAAAGGFQDAIDQRKEAA